MWYQGETHFVSVAPQCFDSALGHRSPQGQQGECFGLLSAFSCLFLYFQNRFSNVHRVFGVMAYSMAANLFRAVARFLQAQNICSSSYWSKMSQKAMRRGQWKKSVDADFRLQIHRKTKMITCQLIVELISSSPLFLQYLIQRCTLKQVRTKSSVNFFYIFFKCMH